MVYVVERYLPGLNRSELLRGLLRLEQGSEKTEHRTEVRYLDSTIVLRDEACFCRFEGPSSDAVAEVNRQAGLPFDRIVAAVTVHPKGVEMSVSPSIPATVEIKRGRFIGLVAAVALAAAAVTWILVAFAFDSSSSTTASSGVQASAIGNPLPPASLQFRVVGGPGSATSAAQDARKVPSVMSLTPARLAGGALGAGYALPTAQSDPTTASILASMSPQTRQYTRAIMNLTFAQLAAGAAGHP
jgi:Nickel responsive protein SCO4226-like